MRKVVIGVLSAVAVLTVVILVLSDGPRQDPVALGDSQPAAAEPATAPQPEVEARAEIPAPEYDVPRTVRYRFVATNRTGKTLENVKLTMFSPMQNTATQRLVQLESNQSFRIIEDGLGNRVMALQLERLPPYASKVINVESKLMMAGEPQYTLPESMPFYLRDGKLFDLDDGEIIKVAKTLRRDDARATALAIYDWVDNYLDYAGYIASDRGASYALRTAQGDCTEYAYLLAALARINGIPARIMAGFVYDNNAVLRPYDYHNWVELYLEDRWRIADPLNDFRFDNKPSHVALRVIGGDGELNHLASQKGIEHDPRLEVKMQ